MSQTSSPRETSAHTVRLADQIIRAGTIYAMTEDRRRYQALAIRGEHIVAVSEDPHGLDIL